MSTAIKTEEDQNQRLDERDVALLRPAILECNEANQQLQIAQSRMVETRGAVNYLLRQFKEKYHLNDGDDIDLDGNIVRKQING